MQDRYAGDVGDFGKFSLLRYLFFNSQNKIGIVWYLFPDESHNEDGGYIDYLTNRRFLDCDQYLCEKLSSVVHGNRTVASLEKATLLPTNTVYFSERLEFHLKFPSQKHKDRKERKEKRIQWLENAAMKVSKCNIIFLDPDNGLQISSCSNLSRIKSGKFAYYFEISQLAKDKNVTIIYHHLGRSRTHADQILSRAAELREHILPTGKIFALRYWPYSPRAYFVLTSESEEKRTRDSLLSFLHSSYGKFWDSYYEEGSSD
jgi:hypothetical protein